MELIGRALVVSTRRLFAPELMEMRSLLATVTNGGGGGGVPFDILLPPLTIGFGAIFRGLLFGGARRGRQSRARKQLFF